jgi:hypothetical protein
MNDENADEQNAHQIFGMLPAIEYQQHETRTYEHIHTHTHTNKNTIQLYVLILTIQHNFRTKNINRNSI